MPSQQRKEGKGNGRNKSEQEKVCGPWRCCGGHGRYGRAGRVLFRVGSCISVGERLCFSERKRVGKRVGLGKRRSGRNR